MVATGRAFGAGDVGEACPGDSVIEARRLWNLVVARRFSLAVGAPMASASVVNRVHKGVEAAGQSDCRSGSERCWMRFMGGDLGLSSDEGLLLMISELVSPTIVVDCGTKYGANQKWSS